MKTSTFAAVCLFLALALGGGLARAESVKQNGKIVFDKDNYLVFEDVGRVETPHMIQFGKKIVLHVTRDGKSCDMDLGNLDLLHHDSAVAPLSTQIGEIRYRDKDRIWIISRLGRRLDGAMLFNLKTQKPDWSRAGTGFVLSPDARHLAYGYPVDRDLKSPAVFVNTVMVYPKVLPGFTRQDKGLGDPMGEDGGDFYEKLSASERQNYLASEIKWAGNGEIQFAVLSEAGAKEQKKQIRVTGLEDLTREKAIKTALAANAPAATATPVAPGRVTQEDEAREGATLRLDPQNYLAFQYLAAEGIRIHFTRDGKPGTADVRVGETNRGDVLIDRIVYLNKDRIWIFANNYRMGGEAVLLNLADGRVERHFHGDEMTLSPDKTQVAYHNVGKRFWGDAAAFADALMLYPKCEVLNRDGLGDAYAKPTSEDLRAIVKSVTRKPSTDLQTTQTQIIMSPRWLDNTSVEFIVGERAIHGNSVDKPWARITRYGVSGIRAQGGLYRLRIRQDALDPVRLGAELAGKDSAEDPGEQLLARLPEFTLGTATRTAEVPIRPFQPRVDAPAAAAMATTTTAAAAEPVKKLESVAHGERTSLVDCLGGEFRDFALEGGRACLATGYCLTILDVTQPNAPRSLGRILLSQTIEKMALSGSLVCVATGNRFESEVPRLLSLIDISDPARPVIRGACRVPYLPNKLVAGAGRFWATGKFGLAELDPAHPEAPAIHLAPFGPWDAAGIAIDGSLAYVTDNFYGLRVVDISKPGRPGLLGAVKLPGGSAGNMAVVGGKVYVACGTLQVVDAAHPNAPVLLPPVPLPIMPKFGRPLIPNRLLRIGSLLLTDYQDGLCLIDLADPARPAPRTLESKPVDGWASLPLAIQGQRLWGFNTVGLQILDFSNPSAPASHDVYPLLGSVDALAFQGQRLYANGNNLLKILSLARPEAPTLRGTCLGSGSVTALAADGGRLYAAPRASGIQAYDVANPDAPKLLGQWKSPAHSSLEAQSLAARGSLVLAVYTSSQPGAELIDFSQPGLPRARGSIAKSSNLGGGVLLDSLACLAEGKLTLFDIANPDLLKPRAVLEFPSARAVAVSGTLAAVIYGRTELGLADLKDPDHPAKRGSIALDKASFFSKLAVAGGVAAVTSDRGGLATFIDLANPDQPKICGKFVLPGTAIEGVALSGAYAYLALGAGGLAVVRHEP